MELDGSLDLFFGLRFGPSALHAVTLYPTGNTDFKWHVDKYARVEKMPDLLKV